MLINQIFFWIGILLTSVLIFPFLITVNSLIRRYPIIKSEKKQIDFACIITSYGNISICKPLIKSLLDQRYGNFHIYLVADNPETELPKIIDPKLTILRPGKVLGSKVKSFKFAIKNFVRDHDAVIVYDPDNLAKNNFLSVMNDYMADGFLAVQGKRLAKNIETIYSQADAVGEIYKNYIERYATYVLGSSATISGSGMAVNSKIFQEFLKMEEINNKINSDSVIVAEDKLLQNFIIKLGKRIAFAKEALIYDEKVSSAGQVRRQRSRWLMAYFQNIRSSVNHFFRGISKKDWNSFLFSLLSLYPPLLTIIGASFLFMVISLFVNVNAFYLVFSGFIVFFLNVLIILRLSFAPAKLWRVIWALPLFLFQQLLALFSINKAKKSFMNTQHRHAVYLDELEETKRG